MKLSQDVVNRHAATQPGSLWSRWIFLTPSLFTVLLMGLHLWVLHRLGDQWEFNLYLKDGGSCKQLDFATTHLLVRNGLSTSFCLILSFSLAALLGWGSWHQQKLLHCMACEIKELQNAERSVH